MRSTYFHIDKTVSALICHLPSAPSSMSLLWFVCCIFSIKPAILFIRVLICHVACLLRCGRRNLQWAILAISQSPTYTLLCTEQVHSCSSYSPIITALAICWHVAIQSYISTQIARIMGPTWGPPGVPHVGPMNLAIRVLRTVLHCTLLSQHKWDAFTWYQALYICIIW